MNIYLATFIGDNCQEISLAKVGAKKILTSYHFLVTKRLTAILIRSLAIYTEGPTREQLKRTGLTQSAPKETI